MPAGVVLPGSRQAAVRCNPGRVVRFHRWRDQCAPGPRGEFVDGLCVELTTISTDWFFRINVATRGDTRTAGSVATSTSSPSPQVLPRCETEPRATRRPGEARSPRSPRTEVLPVWLIAAHSADGRPQALRHWHERVLGGCANRFGPLDEDLNHRQGPVHTGSRCRLLPRRQPGRTPKLPGAGPTEISMHI